MPDSIYSEMLRREARGRWVRLRTLTTLRWLAALGQAGAVVAASQVFDIDLPLELCGLAIIAAIIFNVVSMQLLPSTTRLDERAAAMSMMFDLAQVSTLLALSGGLANPFAMLILAPVTMSASTLTLRSTVAVAATAFVLITVMARWSLPLAFSDGQALSPPALYIFGVWASLTISILFMTFYARRVSVENYRMSRALRVAEAALSREQRLTAIGGLAAAAAHELGTPLATIKLVSGELADELADDKELREDVELIRSQADRCRDILADLSQGGRSDEHVKSVPVATLIEEAAAPHRDRGAHVIIRASGGSDDTPMIQRAPEIVHGLRNLIQNAVDFADSTVWIDAVVAGPTFRILVGDDGPGFPDDMLQRLGDPYVTSRPRTVRTESRSATGEYSGMGLGLFIAKTLLERSGARVSFANADRRIRRENRGAPLDARRAPGAVVAAVWPRESVLASERARRAALGENKPFTLDNI